MGAKLFLFNFSLSFSLVVHLGVAVRSWAKFFLIVGSFMNHKALKKKKKQTYNFVVFRFKGKLLTEKTQSNVFPSVSLRQGHTFPQT